MIFIDKVTLYGAPQHHKRDFPKVMKASLADLVRFWHKNYLPRHFRTGAAARYKYKERTRKHKAEKRRKRGTVRPLVYSGLTEEQVTRFIFVQGTSSRVRGTMVAPWYVRERPTRPRGPALAKELTATAPDEHEAMQKRFRDTLVQGLRNIRTREVVRL